MLLFLSCNKNDSISTFCLLTSSIDSTSYYTSTSIYTYTNNKWTGGSDVTGTYTVIYDNQNRVSEQVYQTPRHTIYTYDEKNKLIEIIWTYQDSITTQHDFYAYNLDGQMITYRTHRSDLYHGPDSAVYNFKYANSTSANYISAIEFSYSYSLMVNNNGSNTIMPYTETFNVTYEYDNKVNPWKESPYPYPLSATDNNITKTTWTSSGGTNYVETIAYTYNSKGYPLTGITTLYTTSTSKQKYIYSNCE